MTVIGKLDEFALDSYKNGQRDSERRLKCLTVDGRRSAPNVSQASNLKSISHVR